MAVEFQDFSFEVKAALDDTSISWLYTWSEEIASQAKRNCAMDGEQGDQLRGSYRGEVNEGAGNAMIGSSLEAAYWEEWGTGEHAAHGDGRKGWWLYIEGQASMGGGRTYRSQAEAERMAKYIKRKYNKTAVVTNGREPNYTLEKAFTVTRPKAEADLEQKLKERMGK